MLCSCGRPHVTLLAEKDADQLAIEDLSAQLRDVASPQRQILIAKIAALKIAVKADKSFRRSLKRSHRELSANLASALELTSAEQLLALSREQLSEFVLASGLGLAIDDFIGAQDAIAAAALDTLQVVIGAVDPAELPSLDALTKATADQVFQDVILPGTLQATRTALEGMVVGVPERSAIKAMDQRLESMVGTQMTQVNTELAQFGRAVTASAAEAFDLDLYLYTGPRDGVTRSFCRPLINKVVDEKQMARLDNGQGLPVKTSGGGYNCRHSWSPVTESFAEAAGLERATSKDIRRANEGGAR